MPANLGKEGYLTDITKATDDIDVPLIFCNAGYLLTGFFHNRFGEFYMGFVHGVFISCRLGDMMDKKSTPLLFGGRS